jgi:hypothetical protein
MSLATAPVRAAADSLETAEAQGLQGRAARQMAPGNLRLMILATRRWAERAMGGSNLHPERAPEHRTNPVEARRKSVEPARSLMGPAYSLVGWARSLVRHNLAESAR